MQEASPDPHAGAEAPPPVEREPDESAAQLEDLRNRYLRLAADFENFKKRVVQERSEILDRSSAAVAERLLPIVDDAERALANVPEGTEESWLGGLRLTLKKLQDLLTSMGVVPIEAVGRPFDPSRHEAAGWEETSEQPEGTVVAELRRGYTARGKVLRPSLVKVARASSEA